jgi:Family of unknown function (DUF6090)
MIKFFRKIRQNLLMENKTGKYFKYAIGEIILVVIGILIALQINNWNENRKNHKKLTRYLYGTLGNFKSDLEGVTYHIDILTDENEKRKLFINHSDYNVFTRDSLEQSIKIWQKGIGIFNMDNDFKQIENAGIEYGIYEDVINDILEHYNWAVSYMLSAEKEYNQSVDRDNNYLITQQNNYEYNYVEGLNSYQTESQAKESIIELLKSPTLRNILKMDYQRNEYYIKQLISMQTRLKEMIPKLENTLETNSIQLPVEN